MIAVQMVFSWTFRKFRRPLHACCGWLIWWMCAGCGGQLTEPSGALTSPNYPEAYDTSLVCVWYVSVEPGKRINITIVDFNVEAHVNCSYDRLAVSHL